MTEAAAFSLEEAGEGGAPVLRLSGSLSIACLGDLPNALDAVPGPVGAIDVREAGHMDTIGAWLVAGKLPTTTTPGVARASVA